MTPSTSARDLAEQVVARLSPLVDRIEIAGSIRRGVTSPKDIEIVAVPSQVSEDLFGETRYAIQEITDVCWGMGYRVPKAGDRYIQVEQVLESPYTLDLFLVHPPAEWGTLFAIRTGPASWSRELVTRIRGRLWRCQDGHVVDERGQVVPTPEEADFFRTALTPWVPPEQRVQDQAPPRDMAAYHEGVTTAFGKWDPARGTLILPDGRGEGDRV
jgi:DNA polymerase/3'-5' exonuclease PolX